MCQPSSSFMHFFNNFFQPPTWNTNLIALSHSSWVAKLSQLIRSEIRPRCLDRWSKWRKDVRVIVMLFFNFHLFIQRAWCTTGIEFTRHHIISEWTKSVHVSSLVERGKGFFSSPWRWSLPPKWCQWDPLRWRRPSVQRLSQRLYPKSFLWTSSGRMRCLGSDKCTMITFPEKLTCSPLKMMKMDVSFWDGLFSGAMLVLGSVCCWFWMLIGVKNAGEIQPIFCSPFLFTFTPSCHILVSFTSRFLTYGVDWNSTVILAYSSSSLLLCPYHYVCLSFWPWTMVGSPPLLQGCPCPCSTDPFVPRWLLLYVALLAPCKSDINLQYAEGRSLDGFMAALPHWDLNPLLVGPLFSPVIDTLGTKSKKILGFILPASLIQTNVTLLIPCLLSSVSTMSWSILYFGALFFIRSPLFVTKWWPS